MLSSMTVEIELIRAATNIVDNAVLTAEEGDFDEGVSEDSEVAVYDAELYEAASAYLTQKFKEAT